MRWVLAVLAMVAIAALTIGAGVVAAICADGGWIRG